MTFHRNTRQFLKTSQLDTLTKQGNQQSSYLIISCVHCTVLAMQIRRIHNRITLTCSYCYISICALIQCYQLFQFNLRWATLPLQSNTYLYLVSESYLHQQIYVHSSVLFLFEAATDFCCSLQLSNSFRLLSDHLYSIPRIQLYKATKSYTQGIRYKVLLSCFDAIWFAIHSFKSKHNFIFVENSTHFL